MEKHWQNIRDFSLTTYLKNRIKQADRPFWAAFFIAFAALNLLFLFHGAHYMFGDHDWKYIKNGVPLDAGFFEGRFTQFLPINLLTSGDILPLINNALGFAGFSLGLALLAKYWRLPHQKTAYILFALFTAVTPYILSFMYFAFLVIPVLSWNAAVIGALIISEKETTFSLKKTAAASVLLALALGGYPPVINLFAVALTARVLFSCLNSSTSLSLKSFTYTVLNFLLAALIWKLALLFLSKTGALQADYYNLQTTPVSEWGAKLLLVLKDIFLQFSITLPFITAPYKIAAALITLTAFITIATKSPPKCDSENIISFFCQNKAVRILLLSLVFMAGLITLFLSPSLEQTEFSPRIDFFGLMYAYAAAFAVMLHAPKGLLRNISLFSALFCIIYNAHTLLEAEKVWKLGIDAELKLYRRVQKRFEAAPNFYPERKYIMVQAGFVSLRPKYYHTSYTRQSDDLLDVAYIPGLNSAVMWNFFSAEEYADKPAYVYRFQPDAAAIEWIKEAPDYPKVGSVVVGDYYILLSLNPAGRRQLQEHYHL